MVITTRIAGRLPGLVLAGAAALAAAGTAQAQSDDCAPADGAEFVCGLANLEKLIRIDGTRLGIGGALNGGPMTRPPFYFFDFDAAEATPVSPDDLALAPEEDRFPDCPAPDFAEFVSLGIDTARIDGRDLF